MPEDKKQVVLKRESLGQLTINTNADQDEIEEFIRYLEDQYAIITFRSRLFILCSKDK